MFHHDLEKKPMSTAVERAREHVANMTALGYYRVSENRCPRRLVGKRHLQLECWCTSRLNDHAGTYRHHGQKVVLWEPYGAWGEELVRVLTAATADGLRVQVHSRSPYSPGRTLALEFTQEVPQ